MHRNPKSAIPALALSLWLVGLVLSARAAAPAGRLAAGTPAETPWFVKDSGKPGPVVFIAGGVHGDEPAGAAAAAGILAWELERGKLILLPRANVVALEAGKRNTPGLAADLGNLNRNFPRHGETEPPRGALATEIWELVRAQKVHWLLDLHEGFDFNGTNTNSVGSSVIAHPAKGGRALAQLMLDAVNAGITNAARKFKLRGPPVDGSLARGAAEHLGAGAMILETTTKDQPLALRVAQHQLMVRVFLAQLGLLKAEPAAGQALRIGVFEGDGSFGQGVPRVSEQLAGVPGARVTLLKPEDIRNGALAGCRVVIFTGGSGSKQAEALGPEGRAQVKQFIEAGGGYLGICAGAYLACENYSWGLKVLDAKTVSPKWKRGKGDVQMELTEQGRAIFGDRAGAFTVRYANGPIIQPAANDLIPDYQTLAVFRTELAENDSPKGVMVNAPAISAGRCGRGRVLCISPHPEQTEGLEQFVPRAVQWLAQPDAAKN